MHVGETCMSTQACGLIFSVWFSTFLPFSLSSLKTDWVIQFCFRRCTDADYFYPLAAVFCRARWRRPSSIQLRSVTVTLVAFLKLNQYKLCLLNGIMDFFFLAHGSWATECNQY